MEVAADSIRSAFSAIAIYIPLMTFMPFVKWIFWYINDTKDIKDSITTDANGINLNPVNVPSGKYTCEIKICYDVEKGKNVIIPEHIRFEPTLVIGGTGSGKNSTVLEPMVARDIEKKYFFREVGKEMAMVALKTGIAALNVPYTNDYINANFNLNMIAPNEYKSPLFKEYMKKMIYYESSSEIVYRNIGVTAIAPEHEFIKHVSEVAKNYDIPVNIIDPEDNSSMGLNPFAQSNVSQIATSISSALKTMYLTTHTDTEETFMENIAYQAVENLAILLTVMYPKLNNGAIPNLEDMLKMLNNFDLVEEMCEKLKQFPDLKSKYELQIGYFEKNFYKPRDGEKDSYFGYSRKDTERFVYSAVTQLDSLLRHPGVKNILCNRRFNVDFDKALANGEFTFICSRRGELGDVPSRAFTMFVILSLQNAILRRPGVEKSRIPHFLYVDEFTDYISKATEPIFTLYRKYRCGSIITAQSLSQLEGMEKNASYKDTIIANCQTKMLFGNAPGSDLMFWEAEFGKKRDWKGNWTYDTKKGFYKQDFGSPDYYWKPNFYSNVIQDKPFKGITYKTRNLKGKYQVGAGATDFIEDKYKKKHETKSFNFDKYSVNNRSAILNKENNQLIISNDPVDNIEDEPIIYNDSSADKLFNNGMTFDLKKKSP